MSVCDGKHNYLQEPGDVIIPCSDWEHLKKYQQLHWFTSDSKLKRRNRKKYPTHTSGGIGIGGMWFKRWYIQMYTEAVPPVGHRFSYTGALSCVQRSLQYHTQYQVWHGPRWYSPCVPAYHHLQRNMEEQKSVPPATKWKLDNNRLLKFNAVNILCIVVIPSGQMGWDRQHPHWTNRNKLYLYW